jgi:phage gp36-like protein
VTAYADRTHLAQWGLPAEALGDIPTATQDAALASASELADSYLRARYSLPLASWGNDLRQRVCELAAAQLITTVGFNPQGRDEAILLRAQAAERWLRMVSERVVHPNVSEASAAPSAFTPFVMSDTPRGW